MCPADTPLARGVTYPDGMGVAGFQGARVGRYLLQGDQTVWVDGPLTQAVRSGAVCYLDEIVEARKDTIVLIHPLTDHRRILPVDKLGQILPALKPRVD